LFIKLSVNQSIIINHTFYARDFFSVQSYYCSAPNCAAT
jgi:hypothetical protein